MIFVKLREFQNERPIEQRHNIRDHRHLSVLSRESSRMRDLENRDTI